MTVWPYRSESDAGERARDIEETKRLLYVASTRARDRLYLSAVACDGEVACNRGSFGEVLPKGLACVLTAAADHSRAWIGWEGPGGATHEFRIVTHEAEERVGPADPDRGNQRDSPNVRVDLSPVGGTGSRRTSMTEVVESLGGGPPETAGELDIPPRPQLVGTIVHRLLQRFPRTTGRRWRADHICQVAVAARASVRVRYGSQLALRAVELYGDLGGQPDVVALRGQECLFEVPFSVYDPGATDTVPVGGNQVLTGAIDCLAKVGDGRVRVLEFKTGPPRPEHNVPIGAVRCRGARDVSRDGCRRSADLPLSP